MSDSPSRPRNWSGIGCAAFFLAFFLFVVCYRFYRQPDPDRDLVPGRQVPGSLPRGQKMDHKTGNVNSGQR